MFGKVYIKYDDTIMILNKSKYVLELKRLLPYDIRGILSEICNMTDCNNFIINNNNKPIHHISELCENLNISRKIWANIKLYNEKYDFFRIIKIYNKKYFILNPNISINLNFELNEHIYNEYKNYFLNNIKFLCNSVKTKRVYDILIKDISNINDIEIEKLKFKFSKDEQYKILNDIYDGCGVYVLYKDGIIIYIGKSKNIKLRTRQHRKDKDFDCVKSIIFKDTNLVNLYEPYLIQKYQPKYNNDLLEKFEFELPEIKL